MNGQTTDICQLNTSADFTSSNVLCAVYLPESYILEIHEKLG